MNGKSMKKKGLVVGIILLLIAKARSPVISACNDTIVSKTFSIPKKEDEVSITVLEYKSGTSIYDW